MTAVQDGFPAIRTLGLTGLLVSFADRLSEPANRAALAFRAAVEAAGIPGVEETSTSLASVIGFLELLRITQGIYSANFQVVELLAVAAFWYLAMTAIVTAIQTALEKVFPVR